MVLIDAAKGCTTEPPNLTVYPADFVVCSFYKIFGYPTGLGALIVKNGTTTSSYHFLLLLCHFLPFYSAYIALRYILEDKIN